MISILHHLPPGFPLILPVFDLSPVKEFVVGSNNKKYFYPNSSTFSLAAAYLVRSFWLSTLVSMTQQTKTGPDWALRRMSWVMPPGGGRMLRGSEAGVLSPVSHPWRGKQTTDPVTGLLRFTGSSLRSVLYFKDIALHELVMGWVTHTFYFRLSIDIVIFWTFGHLWHFIAGKSISFSGH